MANTSQILLPSQVRSASVQTGEQVNSSWRGVILFLVVTVAPAQTLTLQIEAKDPAAGTWAPLSAFPAAIASFVGTKLYTLYPGAVETGALADMEVMGIPLPQRWRANITHGGAGNFTYSLGAHLIL